MSPVIMKSQTKEPPAKHSPSLGILGCSGFIGYALLKTAQKHNLRAKGLTRQSRMKWKSDELNALMTEGDANNDDALLDLYSSADTIVDCASSLKPSKGDDSEYLMEAMRLDHRIKLAKQAGVSKYIYISSGGALYTDTCGASSEDSDPKPTSRYGLGKQICEDVIAFHSRKGELEAISARTSNPYGEHHTSLTHGFINVFIRNMLKHRITTIYGNPDFIQKDYIYIIDAAQAIIDIARHDTAGHHAINVGFGTTYSLSDIIQLSCKELNTEPLIQIVQSNSHDNLRFALDTSLLRHLTKFTPCYTLEKGISCTIEWESKQKESV